MNEKQIKKEGTCFVIHFAMTFSRLSTSTVEFNDPVTALFRPGYSSEKRKVQIAKRSNKRFFKFIYRPRKSPKAAADETILFFYFPNHFFFNIFFFNPFFQFLEYTDRMTRAMDSRRMLKNCAKTDLATSTSG